MDISVGCRVLFMCRELLSAACYVGYVWYVMRAYMRVYVLVLMRACVRTCEE